MNYYIYILSYELHCTERMMLLNDVCFVIHVTPFFLSFVLVLLNKIGGQFNERLLFWHILVFNCYYSYLFYVVLENKIW